MGALHTVAAVGALEVCEGGAHVDVLQTRVPRHPRTQRDGWRPSAGDPGRVELWCRGCGEVWHSPHVVLGGRR